MGKKPLEIKIGDIPDDMEVEDYPEDTIFILDDYDPAQEDAWWDNLDAAD